MTDDLAADLDLARAATRAAGEAVMEHFQRDEPVHFKSPDQPVTAADLLADSILRERLLAARPGDGWLSEETADHPDRLARQRVWVVDPIDGTNSFVAGLPEFVVSVGLLDAEGLRLGVIYNPATDEMYHAARGGGAFRQDRPIRVSEPPPLGRRPDLLCSRVELAEGALEPLRARWAFTPLGSTAYRMVKVADGSVHATWSGRLKHDWDLCAAALIVAEAGGTVSDTAGAPLVFNRPAPVHAGVVAYGTVALS